MRRATVGSGRFPYVALGVLALWLGTGQSAQAQADLVVTAFTATVTDRDVTFDATICNQGSELAGGHQIAIFVDSPSQPGCTLSVSSPDHGWSYTGQQPGACRNVQHIRYGAPTGDFTAFAVVDSGCQATESSEGNNAMSTTYTVNKPDLYVQSFDVTVAGTMATFSGQICNQGTSAIGGHSIAIFPDMASAPTCGTGVVSPAGGTTFSGMTTGTCRPFSIMHDPWPDGTYTAWIAADNACMLDEVDETNNQASKVYQVGQVMDASVVDAGMLDASVADASLSDAGAGDASGPTVDAGCCGECTPSGTVSFKSDIKKAFEVATECPGLGGEGKLGAKVTGALSGDYTGCPVCKGTLKGEATVEAEVKLCNQLSFVATGGGAYSVDKQYCVGCPAGSCGKSCLDSYCLTDNTSGTAGLKVSRFFGYKMRKSAGGVGVAASCGVTVSGSLTGKASFAETEDGACAPCKQCDKTTAELTLGVQGDGGCSAAIHVGRLRPRIGCAKCGSVKLELNGGSSQQTGACGDQGCKFIKVASAATMQSPKSCVGFGWFKVGVQCKAEAGGECVADSCKGKSCAPKTKVECTVLKGSSACE